jgi:hypothetical protein
MIRDSSSQSQSDGVILSKGLDFDFIFVLHGDLSVRTRPAAGGARRWYPRLSCPTEDKGEWKNKRIASAHLGLAKFMLIQKGRVDCYVAMSDVASFLMPWLVFTPV